MSVRFGNRLRRLARWLPRPASESGRNKNGPPSRANLGKQVLPHHQTRSARTADSRNSKFSSRCDRTGHWHQHGQQEVPLHSARLVRLAGLPRDLPGAISCLREQWPCRPCRDRQWVFSNVPWSGLRLKTLMSSHGLGRQAVVSVLPPFNPG
jgi:hypothetical protein